MANKSTSRKSTSTKSSSPKRGRPSKKAQKQAEISRAWSILMFALGAIIAIMAFVPGENFWSYLRRNFLFGVFGFSGYFVGFVIIYLGVLTAEGKPVKLKMFWACGFILLLSSFMHIFFVQDVAGADTWRRLVELHRLGKENLFSGGVTAGLIALPMTKAFGSFAAKICILVLTVAFFMFLTDTTPYDLYSKAKEKAIEEKAEIAKQIEQNRIAKEERIRQKALQKQSEPAKRKKIDFPIDEKPSRDVFRDDDFEAERLTDIRTGSRQTMDVAVQVEKTFDSVQRQKSIERQRIEEIMRKLRAGAENSRQSDVHELSDTAADILRHTDSVKEEPEKKDEGRVGIDRMIHSDKAYIYKHPPLDLFQKGAVKNRDNVENELKTNAQKLVDTLASFGVQTKIIDISRGPAVTRYELQPQAGVKISKITNLADDIALNLAAGGVRIEAPIPNKAAVGIEVPNKQSNSVNIRTIFESSAYRNSQSPLTIALGEDIGGNVVVTDLTKMPHLLIAGSTGSGKSVCVNSIIISFLYKSGPEDVRLILIDPKVVELAEYNGIPHLMMPVVTDPKKAAGALAGAVQEMEKRYRLFAENSVRDIKSFNTLALSNSELGLEKMPYIAVIIDELADLMMVCGKEVEDSICRLAQKARAAGIHLIVATQRPSVDVITGLIKANIPARIAFAVSSQVDSRTILDSGGAEKLLGMGDMLFLPLGASKPVRVQGTYVKDKEISAVTEFVKKDFVAEYDREMIENAERAAERMDKSRVAADEGEGRDEMLTKAIEVVVEAGMASTSLLQRRLKLGYARAARIMDEMESMGIVGAPEGSKPRQVLITKNQWLEMTLSQSE